jgi:hypothetical protein
MEERGPEHHQAASLKAERLPRLAPLTRVEKARLVTEIVRVYGPMRLRLRRDNLKSLVGLARSDRRAARELSPEQAAALSIRLGKAVARTLMLLPTDSRCLIRSLVLLQMLARRDIEASLVIGVRPGGELFAAHAWVEYRGISLLGTGGGRFSRLLEI